MTNSSKNRRLALISLCLAILMSFALPVVGQRYNSRMLVSTNWLARNLNKTAVLHIGRNREKYDAGHIPGARFIGWGELTTTRDGIPNELQDVANLDRLFKSVGIGNKGRIVIYGDLKGLFAARAFVTLDYLGHGDRVALLDGGLEKWKSEGRNVSTENVKRDNAGFSPDLEVDRVIHLNEVKGVSWSITNLRTAKYSLIDARPGDSYKGITKSKSLERNGHIPGAKNVYWKDHLESDKNPVMKSVKELRALYAGKGLRADKTVITYCQTGGQASHAYFTLKYLGYEVKLYDGSFFEWSRAKGTKVVSFAEVE